MCGKDLYCNKSVKHKNGKHYKDYYFYGCKHMLVMDGHKCTFNKQIAEYKINDAIAEIVIKLVQNPRFAKMIKEKIDTSFNFAVKFYDLKNS